MNVEVLAIAILTAWAASIPGVFLVPRKMTLMADAITHSVLPGLVLGFLLAGTLDGPWPMLGAVAASLITVWLTETLAQSRLVRNDAAIGMVFPAMFSIGVLLVASYADQVHLDTDAVLLGELAFAPLDRIDLGGVSVAKSLATTALLWVFNLVWAVAFFKELKLATFDPALARSLGFSPILIHYGLMTAVSLTAVGAFDAAGSILVVAFVVAPAASAYLLLDDLWGIFLLAPVLGALGALGGYSLAVATDTNIAGAMALTQGVIFFLVFLFSPRRGLVSAWRQRQNLKGEFALKLLLVHLSHHQDSPEAAQECRVSHLTDHIRWTADQARKVVQMALDRQLVLVNGDVLSLTAEGSSQAGES